MSTPMSAGRREAVITEVAAAVNAAGGIASPVVCDVADDASVKSAFDAVKAIGVVELVVFNCAPGP